MDATRARRRTLVAAILAFGLTIALAVVVASTLTASPSARPHGKVSCVECHVSPDIGTLVAVVLGKSVPGRPPIGTVPDSRCIRCHATVTTHLARFSHALHASKGPCVGCHPNVGHPVTPEALSAAGVLTRHHSRIPLLPAKASRVASLNAGSANLPNHVATACARCHDMHATECTSCHVAPNDKTHARSVACTTCHKSDASFAFDHPKAGACVTCHVAPDDKTHARSVACPTCHTPATSWDFTHPKAPADCVACHVRPVGHQNGSCGSCHTVGRSWVFTHPVGTRTCTSCHRAPSNHYGSTCTQCHSVGVAFASAKFRHPGASAVCMRCHRRPANHSGGGCASCHSVGKTWTVRHPSSSRCASCHRAPADHFGSACASCHRPLVPFSRASFKHPRTGEHTYRSFPCVSCHPKGYSSATCVKCHDSPSGPSDD